MPVVTRGICSNLFFSSGLLPLYADIKGNVFFRGFSGLIRGSLGGFLRGGSLVVARVGKALPGIVGLKVFQSCVLTS